MRSLENITHSAAVIVCFKTIENIIIKFLNLLYSLLLKIPLHFTNLVIFGVVFMLCFCFVCLFVVCYGYVIG